MTGFTADVATPDPSDVAWPKWAAWAFGLAGAAAYDYCVYQSAADDDEERGGPDFVVNPDGVAVPVGPGESVGSSPDGKWVEVKDSAGNPTGARLDDGHPKTHDDPRAQGPHAHLPGRTNADGTPWLPSGGRR